MRITTAYTFKDEILNMYEDINSNTLKVMKEGLNDLQHALKDHLEIKLDEKSYQKMFEILFGVLNRDKASYIRSSKKADVLALISSTLRAAVQHGVKEIRVKSVKSLIQHITGILPHPRGGLCEPLKLDHIRTLRTVLEYPPHIENLPCSEWTDLVEFCCQVIQADINPFNEDLNTESLEHSRPEGGSAKGGNRPGLSRGSSSASRISMVVAPTKLTSEVEELMKCLQLLLQTPNAHIIQPEGQVAQMITETVLDFLLCLKTSTPAHISAYSSLNSVLATVSTNNIKLARNIAKAIPRLIGRPWESKPKSALREQMLIALMYSLPHLKAHVEDIKAQRNDRQLALMSESLDNLVDSFLKEYTERAGIINTEQLQLDEIGFPNPTSPFKDITFPLTLSPFYLRANGSAQSEQAWMVLQMVAKIVSILDAHICSQPSLDAMGTEDSPIDSENSGSESRRKRRRKNNQHGVERRFDSILQQANSSSSKLKIVALQLIPFLLEERDRPPTKIDVSEWRRVMADLSLIASEDNTVSANWAILGLASGAFLAPATHASNTSFWEQTWQLCSRQVSKQATCRTACHLMRVILSRNLVPYSLISKSVDSILVSIDLNGPAMLVDSALDLCILILKERNKIVQSLPLQPEERLMRWFIMRWRPVDALDRANTSNFHLNPTQIAQFLLICLGAKEDAMPNSHWKPCFGVLARAWIKFVEDTKLISYLLLEDEWEDKRNLTPTETIPPASMPMLTIDNHLGTSTFFIEFLEQETINVEERWHTLMAANVKTIPPNCLQSLASFLITATVVVTTRSIDCRTTDALIERLRSIQAQLISYIRRRDCTEAHVNAILDLLSPVLPNFEIVLGIDRQPKALYKGMFGETLSSISSAIESWLRERGEASDDDDVDMEVPVRRGMAVNPRELRVVPREALEAACCPDTVRNSTIMLLGLLTRMLESDSSELSKYFSGYVKQLTIPRLLLLKPVICELLGASLLTVDDAVAFLEHLAEGVLQEYDFRVCDSALNMVLSVIEALTPMWIPSSSGSDLVYLCERIYGWLVGNCLEKDTASITLRRSLVQTLLRIMDIDKDFKPGEQSAQTYFIYFLQDIDIRMKLLMAETVPRLFEIYPPSCHSDLYKEVHAYLDKEVRCIERLAMRLYTLSCLAIASQITKRRVVYYLFETSTQGNDVEDRDSVEKYATRCVDSLARSLGLNNPRSLFKTFGSQLIFAWLSNYSLDMIPFRVCGYSSMIGLIEDMKEEIVAQLLMNYQDKDAEDIAVLLGISYESLLTSAFHRIIAYGTAWAVATPPREGVLKLVSVEARVRKRLGDTEYNRIFDKTFPRIVAILFQCMEPEEMSQKLLLRDPSLSSAKDILENIVRISSSQAQLPEPIKPSFKVKVILKAFNHCTKVGGYVPEKVWNPTVFTYVARKMFDVMDSGLGSLHACSIIRKLRLLVCFAGKTVHEGYSLEMLIHGLKPFIVDTFCTQDVIGVVQYLFTNGKAYLETRPTFVISTFLSIMASLRSFIALTPTSQVDSNQLHDSQRTAREFYSWLCGYLSDYTSSSLTKANTETFKAIVDSAIGFKSHGNSLSGTKESELLQILLQDETEENGLLDDVSRHLAFSSISHNFQKPESYREDVYGSDEGSVSVSKYLLRTCRNYHVSGAYLLWAARVLGRAYASSGTIHNEWTKEAQIAKVTSPPRDGNALETTPKTAILNYLMRLLSSENGREVGLAEMTLVDILARELHSGRTSISEFVIPMHHMKALAWENPPETPSQLNPTTQTITLTARIDGKPVNDWIRDLSIAISLNSPPDPVASHLGPLLQSVEGMAAEVFPYLVHLVLVLEEDNEDDSVRSSLSDALKLCFKLRSRDSILHMMILIKTILYLRTQQRKGETTRLDRDEWLDLDYQDLARAACDCRMFKTSLLFIEIYCSREKTNYSECTDLLLAVYRNIDDPDSYYGLNQGASMGTVLRKLDYEQDGWKSLSFRGAQLECLMRSDHGFNIEAAVGSIGAFNSLGLYGLSQALLQGGTLDLGSEGMSEHLYESAWKLEQWNLPCPTPDTGRASSIYSVLRTVNNTISAGDLSSQLDNSLLEAMKQITIGKQTGHTLGASLRTLAMLTELEEVLSSQNLGQLEETWRRFESRMPWMRVVNFSDVEELVAIRLVTFSSIVKRQHLQENMNIDLKSARLYEAKALISACELARCHRALQHAISSSMHLNSLIDSCAEVALDISAAAALHAASVLWDQGEATTSIRMLQALESSGLDVIRQDVCVGRAELLATLGCWISEARLEKPEIIMAEYLEAAITQLQREKSKPQVAGRVFHEFAVFCDRQLNNQSNIEDLERAAKLREKKQAELTEAEKQIQNTPKQGQIYKSLANFKSKAEKWLRLDDIEYSRLRENHEAFLEKSIGNYLRCLEICDEYDRDAIRFCSLWLQYSKIEKANHAAAIFLNKVESRKFIPLMNQLSSRLMNQDDDFQGLLMPLILRICRDHPYHGLYQILSITRGKSKDSSSQSRAIMASRIAIALKQEDNFSGKTMNHLYQAIGVYIRVATYKMHKNCPKRLAIRRAFPNDRDLHGKLEKEIPGLKLPPPTMNIAVRHDCDYSDLPYLQKFNPEFAIAGGVSAPKILTCHDSSGQSYKMLVKGGGDDLRQDAIMEQVFEQVSHLLQRNRQTRQRSLSIRTYKVLPLGVGAGIIEFVPNTIPLHEYSIPAHDEYYPNEWNSRECRDAISSTQSKPRDDRIENFKEVCKHYSPVMRYFFMHQFQGPDEWFHSRLAYMRSTAANSMLGWVLGLGDRHGHNILLDDKSGEVVHIDLGIAFEQGRILPIPEVVPFRLTRDIVDGMGITGTEGVFRRCCEFTLSVLRLEKDNITTILDVLRYDPLYSWTISPIKLQKVQRGNYDGKDESGISAGDIIAKPNQGTKDDAEAERALETVSKKLQGTLSVAAAVNELIQQATDVKNLALLYSGWSAFA